MNTEMNNSLSARWSEEEAIEWFNNSGGFHFGANYIPSTASNQFEMWMDPVDWDTIKKELQWARSLGYTALRVYLHDQLYTHEQNHFLEKIDRFLELAKSHKIKIVLALFDSCWDPLPRYGPQLPPLPGVHNSRWVQSPGKTVLQAPPQQQHQILHPYVTAILSNYGNRTQNILAVDLWNRPFESNLESYGSQDFRVIEAQQAYGEELLPEVKRKAVLRLIPKIWEWAREVGPLRVPLTIGSDDSSGEQSQNSDDLSDVISFSNYRNADTLSKVLKHHNSNDRPIICTGYFSRDTNSTFNPILGVLYQHGISAFHDGFIEGKTQLRYPLDSWQRPYRHHEPLHWHQDILFTNFTPYSPDEMQYLLTFKAIANNDLTEMESFDGEDSWGSQTFWDETLLTFSMLLICVNLIFFIRRRCNYRAYRATRKAGDADFDDIDSPSIASGAWPSSDSSCANSDDSWMIEHVIRQHRKRERDDRLALL